MKNLSAPCGTSTQRNKRASGSESISAASKVMHTSVVDDTSTPATEILSMMSGHLRDYCVSTISPGHKCGQSRHRDVPQVPIATYQLTCQCDRAPV